MTIEFLSQDDPLYILPFFEEFFQHYFSEFEIKRVLLARPMGGRSRVQLVKELVNLYRPLGFLRLAGRLAWSKCMSKLPKKPTATRFDSLKQLCQAYGVPIESIANPNAPEFIAEVKKRNPDLIVSVACPYILKDAFLSIPSKGCVNIHHAPLPRYKGMMPTFWQMFHGERKVGVTVHYMAAKVDEGAALLQSEMEILPNESLDSLIRRSKRHGAHCMADALRQITAGTQKAFSLDQSKGTYFTFPKFDEMREFRRKGLRAI